MTHTYYIGLDVHKETIAIAYAAGENREDAVYHGLGCSKGVIRFPQNLMKQFHCI